MEESNVTEDLDDAVGQFLCQRLSCEVEAEIDASQEETIFVPVGRGFGELRVSHDLAARIDESELLGRMRKEGIDELLRRGEYVRLSAVATEILPQAY
jgi:hypothetical protein